MVAHTLEWLADHGETPTVACCIYATAPFVTPANLQRGYELLTTSGKNFVFTVTTFPSAVQRCDLPRVASLAFPQWVEARSGPGTGVPRCRSVLLGKDQRSLSQRTSDVYRERGAAHASSLSSTGY